MKKVLSFVMTFILVFAMLPIDVLAVSNVTDIPNNWAKEAVEHAVENGLLKGYNGKVYPEKNLTRAEAAAVINRAFGSIAHADISNYQDVDVNSWYYGDMSKAVGMKTFVGHNDKLNPNSPISREEIFTVLARALKMESDDIDKAFIDSGQLSEWSKSGVYALINAGYVNGSNGFINPKSLITRAEFAQIMYNIFKNYVTEAKTYTDFMPGNVLVNVPGATLKDVEIKGDLIIGDGVGEGELTLDSVSVTGRVLVRGGGENSIIIKGNSKIDTIIIVRINGKVRILNESREEIGVATVDGDSDVILEGKFKNIVIESPNISVYANNTTIDEVNINGKNSVLITDKDAEIKEVNINTSGVSIIGSGDVKEVNVGKDGSNAEIMTPKTIIDVHRDADNVIGTGNEEIKSGEQYQNGSTLTQDAKPLERPSTGGSSGGSGGSSGGTVTTYTVNYSVVGNNGTLTGTVTSGNSVNSGTSVTFTATPSNGYEIKEWKVNGVVVESGNTLTRTISSNTTVTVEFKLTPEPERFSVLYYVVGENGALETTINSGVGVEPNTELTFTAMPYKDYEVKEWTVNGEVVEAENTLTITITRHTTVTVEFEEIPPTMYTVNFSRVGSAGNIYAIVDGIGHIYDGNQVAEGTDIIFTADIPSGYEIKEWRYNGNLVEPEDNILTISDIGMDITVTVELALIPIYEATIQVTNVSGATVTVRDSYNNPRLVAETITGSIFIYNLEAGTYSVTIEKDGYYTEVRTLDLPTVTYIGVAMAEVIPGIVTVNNPPIIELNVGQDLPTLPSTVDVVLDTEEVVSLGVVWNTDGFDKNSPENYVLGGTLTLVDGVENPLGLVALQLVDVFAAPEITLDITNTNILRFDFDVPAVWVGEKDITEIGTPEYTKLAFLQDLFSDPTLDANVLNAENINFNYGPGFFEIELLEDAINRDLFWELDRPGGIYGGNGDGIYRKDVTVDLSIFNNHLGLASESTTEPCKLKFAANYNEYGLPDYDDVIGGVWQTAEQRANEIDPVRTMPTYEAFFTDTNVLRIESNQPIYYLDGPMWAEVDKAMLLADLFGHGEDFRDIERYFYLDEVGITMEDTAFEIQLFSGAFDSEFFWNIDHPNSIDPDIDGNPYPLDKDGNGVYRRLNTLDLSIFYNSSWDYVEETVDYYLKLYVPFENGIGKYSEPVQAVWQSVDQRNADIVNDPIMDTTAPMFVSITTTPETSVGALIEEPGEYDIWVDAGEILRFEITANDTNIYRFSPFSNLDERTWYYALPDVYNGDEATRAWDIDAGVTVTYENRTWYIDLGEDISSGSNIVRFMDMDFEDYAGNKWSDIEGDTINRTILFHLSRLDIVALNNAKAEVDELDPLDYTPSSWSDFEEAIAIAMGMPETTQEEIDDKAGAIYMAIDILSPYIEVTQVEIDETYDTIIVGERYNLTTTVLPVDATNKNISWSVIEGPGQIDHTGELIANGEGLIVVRATSQSYFLVWDELAFDAVFTLPNDPPIPYEDTITIKADDSALIPVLEWSTDPEEDELTLVGFTQGTNGTVAGISGSLYYVSNDGFIGTDSITYTVSDGINEVEGTINIVVEPAGNKLTDGSYDGNRIGIYQNGSKLEAVLLDQDSTTALLLDNGIVSPVGIEENANSIYFIYKLNNEIKTVEIGVSGTNAVEIDRWEITSNDGGTLSSEQYVKDSSEILHFVYFDSIGQSSMYEMPDLMYYNTADETIEVLHYGYREHMGGSDYYNSYVHEIPHELTIDNDDNVVVVYAYRDWSSWSGGQNHNYFLILKNIINNAGTILETYGTSSASMKFSNLELIGDAEITVKYDYDGNSSWITFDGDTLTQNK